MTRLGFFEVLRQDTQYAWRSIRRSPALTVMVVLTLGLGLGANAAVFSVLDRMYLRAPAGVTEPEALQRLHFELSPQQAGEAPGYSSGTNLPVYRTIAALEQPGRVAAFTTDNSLNFGQGADRIRVRAVFASASYFPVLGVRPVLGRLYDAAEDSLGNGRPVTVVSHRFWRTALGADTSAIGRQVRIEGEQYTLLGVLSPDFGGLDLQAADVWIPLASIPARHWLRAGRSTWWERVVAWNYQVLRRPATADASFADRATLAARALLVERQGARADTGLRVMTTPYLERGPGELGQDMKIAVRLGGVALIVLVIACANVINLLLARAVSRRREIAVRLALGVSRLRLVQLLTTETILLGLIAGAFALLITAWGGTVLRAQLLPSVQWYESVLHWRVVLFAGVSALLAGTVAGIIPALQSLRPSLTRELKSGAREGTAHRSRLRSGLVIAQAALSLVLLVGAALFVSSLRNVEKLDLGYDVERIVHGRAEFEPGQSPPTAVVTAAIRDAAARLEGRPGIQVVATALDVPMQAYRFQTFFWGSDSSASLGEDAPTYAGVSPTFFAAAGLRIVDGRGFGGSAAPEMLVNERLAQTLWPGRSAIGQCVRFGARDADCYTVIGVVENSRQSNVIESQAKPLYYLPLGRMPIATEEARTLIVRAAPGAQTLARAEMRAMLGRALPAAQIRVESMLESLDGEYWPWRLGARLFSAFGVLALLVAVVGIYSTISYGVMQRRQEFGVRAALGARTSNILRQVVGEGLRVVAIGVVSGIVIALALSKLVATMLFGVAPNNPAVMLAVSAILLVAAVVASLAPAWSASRSDPVIALRSE